MNKAKLVSAHAQDLKRQVGLGLSIDECEDIISRVVDGYESLVKESDSLPCVIESFQNFLIMDGQIELDPHDAKRNVEIFINSL